MMSEETYELIERYLNHELLGEELKSFEQRMKSEPDFAKEVAIHKDAQELVIDQGVLEVKQKLRAIHKAETRGGNSGWKILLSGLAVVLLSATGLYLFNSRSDKSKTETVVVNSDATKSATVVKSSDAVVNNDSGTSIQNKNNNAVNNDVSQNVNTTIVVDSAVNKTDNVDHNRSGKEEAKTPEPSVAPVQSNIPDCSKIKIYGNVVTYSSCSDKSTGKIQIGLNVKGGKKPYTFSIDEESGYGMAANYSDLAPGKYKVFAKDADGCSNLLKEVLIERVNCPKSYSFAPDRGEVWVVPVNSGKSGEIKIQSKSLEFVYTASFTNGNAEVWNGTNKTGQDLPGGLYLFTIDYSDGEVVRGEVTILR